MSMICDLALIILQPKSDLFFSDATEPVIIPLLLEPKWVVTPPDFLWLLHLFDTSDVVDGY